MKKCSRCSRYLPLHCFHKQRSNKDGFRSACKECRVVESRKFYKNNEEKIKERVNNYRLSNLESIASKKSIYSKKNKDRVRARKVKWVNQNRDTVNNCNARRRAIKLLARPVWAEEDKIAVLYEKAKWLESLTGLKYHVDHIIPLNHPEICGLHVWANLQILTESDNCRKGNNFTIRRFNEI